MPRYPNETLPDASPLEGNQDELRQFFISLAEEYPSALASDLSGALSQAAQEIGSSATR